MHSSLDCYDKTLGVLIRAVVPSYAEYTRACCFTAFGKYNKVCLICVSVAFPTNAKIQHTVK